MSQQNAIVLLSGGMDSAVALAIARTEGLTPYALTVDYGQRHHSEVAAARRVAAALGTARHIILPVDLTQWGGSALTTSEPVPMERDPAEMGREIPVTYVPARNTIFLALAMAWAETLGTGHVFIGAHTLDYSGYPDCRGEYFRAFETMADLATKAGVEGTTRFQIHAPLLNMTKTEIVRKGSELAVPFELTISCYQSSRDGDACGRCDACILRREAFAQAGISDPTRYAGETTRP